MIKINIWKNISLWELSSYFFWATPSKVCFLYLFFKLKYKKHLIFVVFCICGGVFIDRRDKK